MVTNARETRHTFTNVDISLVFTYFPSLDCSVPEMCNLCFRFPRKEVLPVGLCWGRDCGSWRDTVCPGALVIFGLWRCPSKRLSPFPKGVGFSAGEKGSSSATSNWRGQPHHGVRGRSDFFGEPVMVSAVAMARSSTCGWRSSQTSGSARALCVGETAWLFGVVSVVLKALVGNEHGCLVCGRSFGESSVSMVCPEQPGIIRA